ncbi:hypothetical protein BDA99DRAFT_531969 [Phascolomyces articulosus]|uniref:Uncharacterized protein n=1 Tax=Phascolomyces articulosus TaxID=60185 RepID=A0AAD5KVR0_9FUNG|nr:hypothetical protein BDA99DRAFT_531969 [Phascolomyces articulosus]
MTGMKHLMYGYRENIREKMENDQLLSCAHISRITTTYLGESGKKGDNLRLKILMQKLIANSPSPISDPFQNCSVFASAALNLQTAIWDMWSEKTLYNDIAYRLLSRNQQRFQNNPYLIIITVLAQHQHDPSGSGDDEKESKQRPAVDHYYLDDDKEESLEVENANVAATIANLLIPFVPKKSDESGFSIYSPFTVIPLARLTTKILTAIKLQKQVWSDSVQNSDRIALPLSRKSLYETLGNSYTICGNNNQSITSISEASDERKNVMESLFNTKKPLR